MPYRTRQSSYLRIAAYQVLQLVLYMDESFVGWMNDDILERLLMALKDRIPLKLTADLLAPGRAKADASSKVEIYRGADFQIAYFFRKMAQRHAVLLKDKHLMVAEPSPPPPHPAWTGPDPGRPTKKARLDAEIEDEVDLTGEPEGGEEIGTENREESEDVVVKDEETELGLEGFAFEGTGEEDEEQKPDVKPVLKVSYTGYNIYPRSLVVVVEPYPPLTPSQLISFATPGPAASRPREVRQLSTSVAPGSYRASSSSLPAARAGGRKRGTPLFRSETTPLDDEEAGAVRAALEGPSDEEDLPSQVFRVPAGRKRTTGEAQR